MMNRRTFLKLSAGALVLAAAGGLTGCGETIDLDHPKQEVDGVVFLCDVTSQIDMSGGDGNRVEYKPYFAVWNKNNTAITIPRQDITGVFTENGGDAETMVFMPSQLKIEAKKYHEYSRFDFGLQTENSIESSRDNGTYELRIKYNGKTVIFYYDGENMTSRIEEN